jgi:hypothetical protein
MRLSMVTPMTALGLAYVETDPAEADATTVVQNFLHGQYERPMRVLALNADEGWARDV